jgi:pantetheine-phosphate adenylyltransferase
MERACHLFDEVIVGSLNQYCQKNRPFLWPNAWELIQQSTGHLPNLQIDGCDGLIVDYARQVGGQVIIRGLRAVSDF